MKTKLSQALMALLAFANVGVEARAEESAVQARPEALEACIADALDHPAALEACRGAVAKPCLEASGSTTMSSVLCWSTEAGAWNDAIVRASARLNALLSDKDPAGLSRANEAWSAWAEAECDYWAWEEGGGSGEQVERAQCAARIGADRAIALLTAR